MRLRDILLEIEQRELTHEFVKFVVKELNIKNLPRRVRLTSDPAFTETNLTFGVFNPETDEITVYSGDRNTVDVLRTLAHELVHHRQREEQKPPDGSDGSEVENEANAKAGIIMRKFRYMHPEMYTEK